MECLFWVRVRFVGSVCLRKKTNKRGVRDVCVRGVERGKVRWDAERGE